MTQSELKIASFKEGDRKILSLEGEIDLATVSPLIEALRKAADTGATVVVDMSGVRYIDSQGVRALRTAYQQTSTSGGALMIRGCHDNVDRVLRMVGLDRLVPMEK